MPYRSFLRGRVPPTEYSGPSACVLWILPGMLVLACQARTAVGEGDASPVSGQNPAAGVLDAKGGTVCSGGGCRPVACDEELWLGGLPGAATGDFPVAIVAADFDGDGTLDVATANNKGNSVSLLFGRGNGMFRARVDYQTGSAPRAIVAGDWNRDGKPDLATVNWDDDSVSVFLNRGNGVLLRKSDVKVGRSPNALIAADLDNDGIMDLAAPNSGAASVTVLFGEGDGTFARVDYPTENGPLAIAAADINRDGRMDLAIGSYDKPKMTVLLGQRSRTFAGAPAVTTDGACVSSIAAVDLTGDDKPDLAAVYSSCYHESGDTTLLFAGSGDGSFSLVAKGLDMNGVLQPVDINGDGRLDLAVLNSYRLSVLFGQEAGELPTQKDYDPSVSWGEAMAVGDFNRDGKLDIATADSGVGVVGVVLGSGDGVFPTPVRYADVRGPVLLHDLNGDGRLDVVAVGTEGGVKVVFGNGNGALARSGNNYDVGGTANGIAIGDLNADGKTDMVTTAEPNRVSVLLGKDAGKFAPRSDLAVAKPSICPALGDVNADGKLDLALRHPDDGLVAVWLGNGDGTFIFKSDLAMDHDPSYRAPPSCLVLRDVSGDNILDLVVLDQVLGVAQGLGDGTFGPVKRYAVGTALDSRRFPDSLLLGDLNGDGAIDIVATNEMAVSVLLGRGDGTFADSVENVVSPWWSGGHGAALADINGDGYLDLTSGSGGLSVFLGDGTGTFACVKLYAGDGGGSLAVGDMNGDRRQDVVTADTFTETLTVLMNAPL